MCVRAPASPCPAISEVLKMFPAFCPTPYCVCPREVESDRESCQSRASFFESSTTVMSISISFCGTSSCFMSFSYIPMRETASRTRTAFRRFSARIIGRKAAVCWTSRTDTSFDVVTSCIFVPEPPLMI